MTQEMERIEEETRRFEHALPRLKERYENRWVVFKDGNVCSDHATEDEAYAEGIKRFGLNGGYIIVLVADIEPVPITAGVLYGMQFA